ncbi:ORF18 [Alcelaphine gammaherpesvirus 1]|uniref:Gene 18 protein n=1 Tax=Alcelaphine herpesvirus 1 (strain C500) TaxID=654901 RepID=UL79_ALHV1|nr:ORF18 [Alcelaphine gammaherpesvirus 1]O36368.1 RecName: Full=Gene 18 protein [Alcelaphine herpesvirus 1 strain C500]AAC58065.1 ORF18 [Alcelaphine gammaherpesvirus 1]
MSTNPATNSESLDILGRYVSAGPGFSPGVRALLFKLLGGKTLNTLTPEELRFSHLVVSKMYELGLNVFLLREAVANCGVTDAVILERKVPVEFWKILFDGCVALGVKEDMLLSEAGRSQLWLHLNKNPQLLKGLAGYVLRRLGLCQHVKVHPQNLLDGNFLFNLGSVFSCRLLMVAAFCLLFWGRPEVEPWVRTFVTKIYVLYLIIVGALRINFSVFELSTQNGYCGILEAICSDLMAVAGHGGEGSRERQWHAWLDYLFIFNNNVVLHNSNRDG